MAASNQEDMEEWLLLQAERLQNTIVNVKSGMSLAPPLYFGTRRNTYSDVVSIVTTSECTAYAGTKLSPIRHGKKKQPVPLNEPVFVSPFAGKSSQQARNEHSRRNRALLVENYKFMSKLNEKRMERKMLEHAASNVIQRVWRGFSLRLNFSKLKKRLKMRKKVRLGMHQVTKGTSVILEEKERKKRVNRKQARAATAIQRRYRVILATRVRLKEQLMQKQELWNRKSTQIQCMFRQIMATCAVQKARNRWYEEQVRVAALVAQRLARGRLARKQVQRRRLVLETIAVFMIQSRVRIYLAKKVLAEEKERHRETASNAAALVIQRCYRGKIGRRKVSSLRNLEFQRMRQAAGLCIQRITRGIIGRRLAHEHKSRHYFERRFVAAHVLQRLVRGFLGRRRYKRFAEDEKANIFTQARLGHMEQVDDIFSGFVSDKPQSATDVDHRGNTVLLIASRWGHKRIVRKCLRWGMEINHSNEAGETAVQLAVRHGHAEIAEYLVSKKADVNFYGRTLLHDAARRGMASTISLLLGIGVGINERDEAQQYTALHEAVLSRDLATTTILLENKAKVDAQSKTGLTPLHLAASAGSTEIALTLLTHGADISVVDSKNRTAWRHALSHGHEACAAELRRRWCQMTGEEVDAIANDLLNPEECKRAVAAAKEGNVSAVEDALERGLPLDYADPLSGNTILAEASIAGQLGVLELCCRWGMNLEQQNFYGQTALSVSTEHKEAAFALIEAGANVLHQDSKLRTPIHEAALHGYTFSELLSSEAVSLDLADSNGRTPLHEAAKTGNVTLCRQILNLGASVNVADKSGQTALHLCCKTTNSGAACAQLLIQSGANVQAVDQAKRTALHNAALCGNDGALAVLLKHRASPNATDDTGRTAAHDAVRGDSVGCLRLLLEHGCSPLRKDHDDCSLLMDALALCHNDCVQVLFAADFDLSAVQKSTGDSVLHIASQAGNLYGTKMVLEHTTEPQLQSLTNKKGYTVVRNAVFYGKNQLFPLFTEYGVDFSGSPDDSSTTLMHVAATSPNPSEGLIPDLVAMQISVTQYDKHGYQPLHLAVASSGSMNGNQNAVVSLLDCGAPVNATTRKEGMTPLHCAAQVGNTEACKILLEHGAELDATFSPSAATTLTACQLADKNNHVETVQLLRK